ncbi:hypothetical protein J2S74_001267 [Evansella vedderi]|uniref:Uncharacterized protein n=1 Tax=Evansella vedderi TaxID=38282 RepID=A0ABT9ZSE5_9BACI|nr:hypothetical protein [Evansella vedderi]MDQ0253895.1 hypothetical protein [Evansella vedderi]
MKKQWIFIFIVIILSISTYWPLSFASDTDSQSNEDSTEDGVFSYIHDLFITDGIDIGSEKSDLIEAFGLPETEGMYEGGEFYDYGNRTYFVNPDTEKVNAIALPGDALNMDEWEKAEEALYSSIKLEGMNEMEGLWMEIYDWESYDIMIEREEEEAPPFYIWLTEDSLFTEKS